jgi:poly(beta-D-mannuronate) lyase
MIKFQIKANILLIIVQLFCKPIFPAEYYVHNANEIRTAMAQVQPGDTLTMANSIWVDEDIDFSGNGTENNPIILRAETPGNVILTGKSRLDIIGSYLIVDGLYFLRGYLTEYKVHVIDIDNSSDHCRLTNIAIINYNPDDWGLFYKWVESGGTYNRVDHCYFSGKTHQDALLKILIPDNGPSYSRVDHNYFGDIPVGKSGNGWETIRIQGPEEVAVGNTIVEDNFFYHCDGEIEIISLKAGDNDLRRNTFFECIGSLTCRKNVANRIYNNFFIGNGKYGTGGIRMYSKDHVITNNYFENLNGDSEARGALSYMTAQVGIPEVENILAAFNTIVNCKYTIEVGVGKKASSGRIIPPRDLKFANNIALNSVGELIHYWEDVTGITYEGNIMYGTDIGIPFTTGIDTVDPKLTLAEDGLWRPESDSPAIDGAVGGYPEVTIDIDGQPRNDGNHDIGADELSNEPILNRPLTRDDVGPDWLNRTDLPVAIFITKTGGGSGTVTFDPPNGVYSKGTVVTLTATPDTGYQFSGWDGDLSGSENPTTILMDAHKSITATFIAGTDFQVNDDQSSADQDSPSISVDSNGNFVITWIDWRGVDTDIYAQRYSSDGSPIGANFKVNDDPGSAEQWSPCISSDGSGNFVILWLDERHGNADIYAQRYSGDGSKVGTNFKLNDEQSSARQRTAFISTDSNGNFVSAWQDERNGLPDIYAQRYSSDGSPIGANFKVNDDPGSAEQWSPCISSDGSGNFVITWSDWRGVDTDIYAQRYSSDGSAIGANFKVNDIQISAFQWFPCISSDGSGNFVIAWQDGAPIENFSPDIYAQCYDNNGNKVGTNFNVHDDLGSGGQWGPSISVDVDGNFVITWQDGSEKSDIYAQCYSSGGSAKGTNFRVTYTNAMSKIARDVKLWNGRIYNTWVDENNGSDIWANVLDWNVVGISVDELYQIPTAFVLHQNYPNPFNPSTTIEFTLPKSEYVELKVYNILGKEVATLVSKKLYQGNHTYTFDGKNLASGIYYYQLVAGDYREVKKMMLIK